MRLDDNGELWEQDLIPRPEDWLGFKAALLNNPEIKAVSIDMEGVISLTYRGQQYRVLADYAVEPTNIPAKADRPLVFLPAGDLNGDGIEDHYVYYPDGRRQLIYVAP